MISKIIWVSGVQFYNVSFMCLWDFYREGVGTQQVPLPHTLKLRKRTPQSLSTLPGMWCPQGLHAPQFQYQCPLKKRKGDPSFVVKATFPAGSCAPSLTPTVWDKVFHRRHEQSRNGGAGAKQWGPLPQGTRRPVWEPGCSLRNARLLTPARRGVLTDDFAGGVSTTFCRWSCKGKQIFKASSFRLPDCLRGEGGTRGSCRGGRSAQLGPPDSRRARPAGNKVASRSQHWGDICKVPYGPDAFLSTCRVEQRTQMDPV